jgi:NAD(P)-dependent dehydrogenase (short-subunit alcohol dehydrogenase family)
MTQTALITGAGRGIGSTIALELGRRGWAVAVNYANSAEGADEVCRQIQKAGSKAVAIRGDVGNGLDRTVMIQETISAFGRLDCLVNNAGVTSRGRRDILDAQEDDFDWLMAINLKGPFFLSQLAARHMIQKPAPAPGSFRCIINISSLSAYAVSTNRGDYCMAKAAMGMMTHLWAARLAEHGINVYELRPGVIESDMTAPVKAKYDTLIAEGLLPIKRWGKPEDVARAVAMLAAGELPYTTGDTINIDGGYHIRRI